MDVGVKRYVPSVICTRNGVVRWMYATDYRTCDGVVINGIKWVKSGLKVGLN